MKITDVQAILMSDPLPKPMVMPFYNGRRTILKRDAMLIRIKTDSDLTGYAPGPAHERAAREIHDIIRPFLLGKNPLDWKSFTFTAAQSEAPGRVPCDLELTKTYHAVEVALIDLAAKSDGAAMSELIGGRKRDRIKLYGSAGMYMSPQGYADEAAAIAQMGFSAYKMRPALGPEKDLETVQRMRASVGRTWV
jgi:L-alanine-DL-glutamate epimerase-like enolase superfamily enzyme